MASGTTRSADTVPATNDMAGSLGVDADPHGDR
jgi:hypothetical protein